jgi:predicted DNA-binding protein YlxM (UPF0122 family)
MHRKQWTKKEIAYLKRSYARQGAIRAARHLGCSVHAIEKIVKKLGIRWSGRRPWQEWEERYLKRHYNKDRLPGAIARTLKRSRSSVIGHARVMRLSSLHAKAWTENEKEMLRELYSNRSLSLAEIASRIGRSAASIPMYAKRMHLRRQHHDHEWTQEEHKYVLKHYKKKMFKDIAAHLGLSTDAVVLHANRRGLFRRSRIRYWTEQELEYVRQHYATKTVKEIAETLGRTVKAVGGCAERLHLRKA